MEGSRRQGIAGDGCRVHWLLGVITIGWKWTRMDKNRRRRIGIGGYKACMSKGLLGLGRKGIDRVLEI